MNNEFYAWIHETSVDTDYDTGRKVREDTQRKRKHTVDIIDEEDRENCISSAYKDEETSSMISTEKKSGLELSGFKHGYNQINVQLNESDKSTTHHIKIEGVSTGYPMEMNGVPTDRRKIIQIDNRSNLNQAEKVNNNYLLTPNTDLCQSEFTLRGLEQPQSHSNNHSVTKGQLPSAKKQKINLMKEGSPLDCASLSKDNEMDDNSSTDNKWSECWVKVSNQQQSRVVKSGPFRSSEIRVQVNTSRQLDQELLKQPMMTLDLSTSEKHNSNNLTNILSTHTFTRNDDTVNGSDCNKRKVERLQEKINKTMNKNISERKSENSIKNIQIEDMRSNSKKENNHTSNTTPQKNLNTPKKYPSKDSKLSERMERTEETGKKSVRDEIQSSNLPCYEVKYESMLGEDISAASNGFPHVEDILTVNHQSSINTVTTNNNNPRKIIQTKKLVQKFEFKPNDLKD